MEFYAVITDKRRVTKPLSYEEAGELVSFYLRSSFEIVLPKEETIKLAVELCNQEKIKGAHIFDVFLIATMLSNNLEKIVTVNTEDFIKFSRIDVISLNELDSIN